MRGIIRGYDIRRYATAPDHEDLVNKVCASIEARGGVEEYMKMVAKNAPVTFEMVKNSAEKYNVDPVMMAAIMQVDSGFGQRGLGSKTHNPGNVGNMDDGSKKDFGTWDAGVEAVAKWLSRHRA